MAVDLSLVIPAYNERGRLPATLSATLEYLESQPRTSELIVVDDGSTDGTAELAEEILTARVASSHVQARVLRHGANRGKGAAVRTGVEASIGDIVLFTDADMSTPIADVAILEAGLRAGADVAIGSRAVEGRRLVIVHQPWHRELMGRVFNVLVQILLLRGLWDTQCGFKAFWGESGRRLFSQCRLDGFEFDVEVLYRARLRGLMVREMAVHWSHSPSSHVSPLRDSWRMFNSLLRIKRMVG